jgi:hypothetical protein
MIRIVTTLAILAGAALPTSAIPITETEARDTAFLYLVDVAGVPDRDAASFRRDAEIGTVTHTPTNGYQATLRNDQFILYVSFTRNEVFGIEFRRERQALSECGDVNNRVPVTDEALISTAKNLARRFFPQAPHEQMELVSATSRCGVPIGIVAKFVFRELGSENGVVTRYENLSVELNPSPLHLVSAKYLHSRHTGPVKINASDCTRIVEDTFGDHPGFSVTRLALTEYLREDKPALPLWVVTFDTGRTNPLGCDSKGTCFVHAITGEVAVRWSEYE